MSTRFPRAQLTQHAEQRLSERFRISADEFLAILNSNQGKRIGVSERTHVMHRMLWSPVDGALLVAIQDVINGAVLTVLPLAMYRNHYAENVTEHRIRKVINRMVHAGMAPPEMWLPGDREEYVIVYARITGMTQTLSLGAWKGKVDCYDLSKLGTIECFWIWVAERLTALGQSVGSIEQVTAKFSGGDHQEVEYAVVKGQDHGLNRRSEAVDERMGA